MADVKAVDLLVLEKKDPETGEKFDKKGYVLRVVQWVFEKTKGGTGSSVKLEKRELYLKDGEVRAGKASGFTLDDLKLLKDRWSDVIKAMKAAPKPEPVEPLSEPSQAMDEVPFR